MRAKISIAASHRSPRPARQEHLVEERRATIREEVAGSIKTGARKDLERFVDGVVARSSQPSSTTPKAKT
ncbi:MAG: hypothetical protein U0235_30375 [Polyangiaceae bacterium]